MPPLRCDRPLATFDIFDTVLTRAVGDARSMGYVLAERWRAAGVVDRSPEVVVAARERAEHLAFVRYGERRTTAQGSEQLADLLGLNPALARRMAQDEFDLELELARPVPAQLAFVHRARAEGRVGFLSDTPLPHSALERMLRRVGAMQDGDLLWASNELGAEKSTGRAYAAIARDLDGVPRSWSHTGDNAWADVRMAGWAGVTATLAPRAVLQRYERRLEAAAAETAGLSSLLAGAARRARLVMEAEGSQDDRTPVVTGILGPLLAAFALDAASAAQAAGCEALVLDGAGAADLLLVASPLVQGVHLQLAGQVDPAGRWALASTDVLQGSARVGPAVQRHLGVEAGAVGDTQGWLFDERQATGVSGAGADAVRAVPLLLGSVQRGLALFGEELATALPLLTATADLRGAVQSVLEALWQDPSVDEASAWCGAVPGLAACWPQGRKATATGAARLFGLARVQTDPLLRRARRAVVLAGVRRQVRHGR